MHPTDVAAPRRATAAELGLLGVVLIWGANFTITKATLAYVPPLAMTALRFTLSSAALSLLLRLMEPRVKISHSSWLRLSVVGIIGNSIYQPAFILGLHHTSATNSAVIIGSLPGVVALMAWLTKTERVTPLMAIGICTAIAGMFLVVVSGNGATGGSLLGDLLMVGAVLCWAVYTLGLRTVDPALTPLRVTTVTTVIGTPILIVLGIPQLLAVRWGEVPLPAYGGVIYASLISLVLAYLLWNTGVRRIGASRSSIYSCLIPIVAVAFAWMFLGEVPSAWQGVGTLLVVIGVLLTRKR